MLSVRVLWGAAGILFLVSGDNLRDGQGIGKGLLVHDLRHVSATSAIAAGADVKLVQQMLGHKAAIETLNTYSHLWPDKIVEVVDLVDARRARTLAA